MSAIEIVDLAGKLLFLMFAGHCLSDFALQTGWMSEAKRGRVPGFPAWAALTMHGAIHGGAVALVTGYWWLGAAETLLHAVIDGLKCRGVFGMKVDQALHLLCKFAWTAIVLVLAVP